jgi:hypothetical protein
MSTKLKFKPFIPTPALPGNSAKLSDGSVKATVNAPFILGLNIKEPTLPLRWSSPNETPALHLLRKADGTTFLAGRITAPLSFSLTVLDGKGRTGKFTLKIKT